MISDKKVKTCDWLRRSSANLYTLKSTTLFIWTQSLLTMSLQS